MASDICTCMIAIILIIVAFIIIWMLLRPKDTETVKTKGGGATGNTFRIDKEIGCELFGWQHVDKMIGYANNHPIELKNKLITYINGLLDEYYTDNKTKGGGDDEDRIRVLQTLIISIASDISNVEENIETAKSEEREQEVIDSLNEQLEELKAQLIEKQNELTELEQKNAPVPEPSVPEPAVPNESTPDVPAQESVVPNSVVPNTQDTINSSSNRTVPKKRKINYKELNKHSKLNNTISFPTAKRSGKSVNTDNYETFRIHIQNDQAIQQELLDCAKDNNAPYDNIQRYLSTGSDTGCKLMALLANVFRYKKETIFAVFKANQDSVVNDLRVTYHTNVGYINYILAYRVFTDTINKEINGHITEIYKQVLSTVHYMEENRVLYNMAYCQYLHNSYKDGNHEPLTRREILLLMHRLALCKEMLDEKTTEKAERYTPLQFGPIRNTLDQSEKVLNTLLEYLNIDGVNKNKLLDAVKGTIGRYTIEVICSTSPYVSYEFVSTSMYFPVLTDIQVIVKSYLSTNAHTTVSQKLNNCGLPIVLKGVDIAQCFNNNVNSLENAIELNSRQWIYGYDSSIAPVTAPVTASAADANEDTDVKKPSDYKIVDLQRILAPKTHNANSIDDIISVAFQKSILAALFVYLYSSDTPMDYIIEYLRTVRLSIFAINIMCNTTSSIKNNQLKGNSLIFYSNN